MEVKGRKNINNISIHQEEKMLHFGRAPFRISHHYVFLTIYREKVKLLDPVWHQDINGVQ